MLKLLLDSSSYEALDEALKSHYTKDGDNYKLKVEGAEDTGALKRARDREKQKAEELQKELDEAKEKLESLDNNDAKKKGDIEALTKQHDKKMQEQKDKYEKIILNKDDYIKRQLVDNKASEIANRISTNPDLILPHIIARLSADFDGDDPITKVLGSDGKPSIMSLADLEKEFVADKRFSPIMKGSSASGGGAGSGGSTGGGGAPPAGKKLSEMSGPERIALYNTNFAEFERLRLAENLGAKPS